MRVIYPKQFTVILISLLIYYQKYKILILVILYETLKWLNLKLKLKEKEKKQYNNFPINKKDKGIVHLEYQKKESEYPKAEIDFQTMSLFKVYKLFSKLLEI